MTAPTPAPVSGSSPELFWSAVGAGMVAQLRASRCGKCSRVEFPALPTCPVCTITSIPVPLGPSARLLNVTEVLHPPPDAKIEAPYTLAVAAFDDANLAVLGLLDRHVPVSELEAGLPLEVCALDHPTISIYAFRLT